MQYKYKMLIDSWNVFEFDILNIQLFSILHILVLLKQIIIKNAILKIVLVGIGLLTKYTILLIKKQYFLCFILIKN